MICPSCGTLIPDDVSRCPQCHHHIGATIATAEEEQRWCESCGSPIPADMDACPECGMPVDGAFNEAEGERFSVGSVVSEPEPKNAGFVSAIPPAPKKGQGELPVEERRRHTRLVMLAALAALLVVGGTTLYIVRPWDPNAYTTHATEDADTSMEGFPGERDYLASQDRSEEAAYQESVAQTMDAANSIYNRLGEMLQTLDGSYDAINEYLKRGYLLGDDETHTDALAQVQKELSEDREYLDSVEYNDSELLERCKEVSVLIDYLEGGTDVLSLAWSTAKSGEKSPDTVFKVRSIVQGSLESRGYEAYRELFANAYESAAE